MIEASNISAAQAVYREFAYREIGELIILINSFSIWFRMLVPQLYGLACFG